MKLTEEVKNAIAITITSIVVGLMTFGLIYLSEKNRIMKEKLEEIENSINHADTITKNDTTYIIRTIEKVKPKIIQKRVIDTVTVTEYQLLTKTERTFEDRLIKDNDTLDYHFNVTALESDNDSITVNDMRFTMHYPKITEEKEIIRHVREKQRFFLGPAISFGYDPNTKQVYPTIGLSLGINLLK